MIESSREVGGRQYGGAYAYPVGFMVGQGWGKDPVPMAITPPEEVREWKERCAVAAGYDTLISKLSRQSSRRLQLVQQEHIRVFKAIKDEDAAGAREAMRTHIDNARMRVLTDSTEP
jgi:hypothetical protein